MMKKLLPVAAAAAVVLLSTPALADINAISGTATLTPTGGLTNCATLDNNVTIQFSKGVFGVYACDLAGTRFYAGTCHGQGTNKTQTVTCAWSPAVDAAGQPYFIPNAVACGTDPTAGVPTPLVVTFTGRVGFGAGSGGGQVGVAQFEPPICDANTVPYLVRDFVE